MLSISNLLFESIPEHPDTIIIQNEFYPNGLTQKHIYDYYIKNKKKILEQVKDRDVMIVLATDLNKFVIKRKETNGYIKLNSENYDNFLSGRTVTIYSTMNQQEDFGIVDIDYHDFNQAKNATIEIYDLLYKQNKKLKIKYTGKNSFHILYFFDQKIDINSIRKKLEDLLLNLADKKYSINSTRSEEKINLDLSPNKFRGGFISLYSLSILGLKCVEVSRKQIASFNKSDAKI